MHKALLGVVALVISTTYIVDPLDSFARNNHLSINTTDSYSLAIKCVHESPDHTKCYVRAHDGSLVFAVARDRFWSSLSGKLDADWKDHGVIHWRKGVTLSGCWRAAAANQSPHVAIATADGRVAIINYNTNEVIRKMRYPLLMVTSEMSILDCHSTILSKMYAECNATRIESLGISEIQFSEDDRHLYIAFYDGSLLEVDYATLDIVSTVEPSHWKWISSDTDGPLYEVDESQLRDSASVLSQDISDMKRVLLSAAGQQQRTARLLSTVSDRAANLIFSSNEVRAVSRLNNTILWRRDNLRVPAFHRGYVIALDYSGARKMCVVIDSRNGRELQAWEIDTGEVALVGHDIELDVFYDEQNESWVIISGIGSDLCITEFSLVKGVDPAFASIKTGIGRYDQIRSASFVDENTVFVRSASSCSLVTVSK